MMSSDLRGLGLTDSPGPSLMPPRLQRRPDNDTNEDTNTAVAPTTTTAVTTTTAAAVTLDQYLIADERRRLLETDSKSISSSDPASHIHYMVEKGLLDASLENLLTGHDTSTIRTAKLIKVGDSSQDSSSAASTLGSWGGSASGHDLQTALKNGNTTIPLQQQNISQDFLNGSMEFIEDMSMPSFCESVELVSLDRTIDDSLMKEEDNTPTAMEVSDPKGSSMKSVTFEDQLPASPRTPLTSTSLLDLGDALASSPKIIACTNLIQEETKSSYLSPKQIVDAKKRSWTEASFASGIFAEAGKLMKELDYRNLSGSTGSIGSHHLAPAFSPPLHCKMPSPMCSTASPKTPFDNSLELLDLENVDDSLLQMSPIELNSFIEAGPPLTHGVKYCKTSKVKRSQQDDRDDEFSCIPAHELLLEDQQMPDFDPTRGSILAFKEKIPERQSNESKKRDKSQNEGAQELKNSTKEGEESTMENNMPKLVRENTMDLLSGLSSQSQKMKSLVLGKTEELKKPPEEVLNQTFEEPINSKQLNATFDNVIDVVAVSSNLNVTIEQPHSNLNVTVEKPHSNPVIAAVALLNGTFDQDKPSVALDINVVSELPNKPAMFNGTFNQPEFNKYCNLDLTFDQPDLIKTKQENNQYKADVLNGTFDQPEFKKESNLNGTFDQPESSKRNQLNGTFDQPEPKNAIALNNTFEQKDIEKPAAILNGTFDNPSTKSKGNMNETFDDIPKSTLDCTFESTETFPKCPIVATGLDGTFDRGETGANTTFDYLLDAKIAELNDTFDHAEDKIADAEDLNTTNLMDCGPEALQQFIKIGTPGKSKKVTSTPKPVAKGSPGSTTKGIVTKDPKMSFLQRMSMGLIHQQESTQQPQDSNEVEANSNEVNTITKLVANGPKLADLSRESAATTLRMKQKSLVDRSSKAALGPVKALPFLPSAQTDMEPQTDTVECVTMDVEAASCDGPVSPNHRMTYAVPCDPSSPLGQYRKKHGISVVSVSDSVLDEANKMAAHLGVVEGSRTASTSRLKIEATDDLLDGISVLKDTNSDGSTSDCESKFISTENMKQRQLQAIQNSQENYDGSDEVFTSPNDEVFSSTDEVESQQDTQEASTDSGKSDISVKSDSSVKHSRLGKPQMRAPQSLPKARTGLLPQADKRSSLRSSLQPKTNLQGPLGLNKKSPNHGKKNLMAKPDATGTAINKGATLPAQLDGNKGKRVSLVQRNSLAPSKVTQPKNGKVESTLKPPTGANSKPQSKISPPLHRKSLAPKAVVPKNITANTRQSLAPKAMSTRQSLAPKQTATASRQSLAPKSAASSRQSLAPKPTASRQSLAPTKSQAPTRQSLAPKPVAGVTKSLAKTLPKTLPKPSSSEKPPQKALASPKPVVKSIQRPASPKVAELKKSPLKQSPRRNEENKLPQRKLVELMKPSGLAKPQTRLPMKAGVLEDTTNLIPSTVVATAKGTGLSRLNALKQPGFGFNNAIDKKQVTKLVRKASCLDTSLSSEKDVPAAKLPKFAKFSREPSADNMKIKKIAFPSCGSTSSVDSERPCTPDMADFPSDINSGTPIVFRPGSGSMVTSTPALGNNMGRLAHILNMEDRMSLEALPTPIPAGVSRLRFTSDKSTPSSMSD